MAKKRYRRKTTNWETDTLEVLEELAAQEHRTFTAQVHLIVKEWLKLTDRLRLLSRIDHSKGPSSV